jgi:hypothetical protein
MVMFLSRLNHAVRSRVPYFARSHQAQFSRRYERHECMAVGTMGLVKVGADFPGVILELSIGGCSFRPASMFLLERIGESVTIRCDAFEIDGVIKATRPESYGIQFRGELERDLVEKVRRENGGGTTESYVANFRKNSVASRH